MKIAAISVTVIASIAVYMLVVKADPAQAQVAEKAADYTALKATFAERFPHIQLESIKPSPLPGLLEIRQGTLVAYLTEDGRYLLQGEVIDLERNVSLTEEAASEIRKDLIGGAEKDAMVVFGPDKPQYSVAVFTDIDCTFCRKLHREIGEYAAEGIEIRYLMYPRGGPGSQSWEKAQHVMCAPNQNEAMTLAKNNQPVEARQCSSASVVADSYKLGAEIGLRGTPAIITDDGMLISGYLPPKELKRRLDEAALN